MKIFIPHTNHSVKNKKELFILTRPFFYNNEWIDFTHEKNKWGLDDTFVLENVIDTADVVLFPFSVNYYFRKGLGNELKKVNDILSQLAIKGYAYISGDLGLAYPEFSNITYLRMGGFKSQLSQNNQGFPFSLSDQFQEIFHHDHPIPSDKNPKPIIGFCGHASLSQSKRVKEILKCIKENCRRFFQKPSRKDWEPLFASAYERGKLLKSLQKSTLVKTNFIFRSHYRAGAQTNEQRYKTTLEYYNNISDSDYVLCVRGGGNFSVRLYETLMMGKIPVFVNTDCLLPFSDEIDWKKHIVWVEWEERKNIATIVNNFHSKLSNDDFMEIQIANRKLWKETLSIKNMINMVSKK